MSVRLRVSKKVTSSNLTNISCLIQSFLDNGQQKRTFAYVYDLY